jgi:hypothetical protein
VVAAVPARVPSADMEPDRATREGRNRIGPAGAQDPSTGYAAGPRSPAGARSGSVGTAGWGGAGGESVTANWVRYSSA